MRLLRSKLSLSSLTIIFSNFKHNLRLKINKLRTSFKKSKTTNIIKPRLLTWETNLKHLNALTRLKLLKKLTESPKNLPNNTMLSSKSWKSSTKLKWMNSKILLQTSLEIKYLLTNNRFSNWTIPLNKRANNLPLRFSRNPPLPSLNLKSQPKWKKLTSSQGQHAKSQSKKRRTW